MNGLIELLHEKVHVVASPVADVPDAVIVLPELLCIGDVLSLHGIGIEVVVHVDAIHVVATDDVLHHLTDIVAVFRHTRIQDKLVVVGEAAHRVPHGNMIGS